MSRKDPKHRGTKCLNCETALDISEKYCHHCGQLNSTKKLTVKDFIEEFFANFYAYDAKIRNSIISLFTKPGIAAKEFCEGKRQHYANPFRLFLSISILLFIFIGIKNKNLEESITKQNLNTAELKEINDEINLGVVTFNSLSKKVFHRDSIYSANEIPKNANAIDIIKLRLTSFRNFHYKNPNISTDEALEKLGYEKSRLNKFWFEKSKSLKSNEVFKEISDYIVAKLPFLIFLSIPSIAIIFWIAFYSKQINYTDHLVFCYNFYSFFFIILFLFEILEYFSPTIEDLLFYLFFFIISPFYLYKALRNFYQNSRWKTIIKFILLNLLFMPVAVITFLAALIISVILF